MPKKLLLPDAARDFLVRKFNNQHTDWLTGDGAWPLDVNLGVPTEKDISDDATGVREWVEAWMSRTGQGELGWTERQFGRLGTHRFPSSLSLQTPEQVALAIGQGKRWAAAGMRYESMLTRWPALARTGGLASKFNVLADYSQEDFERLFSLLEWLDANPSSGLYLRQLPVEGLDTKWIGQRKDVVTSLLRLLRDAPSDVGFHELCGIQKPAHRMRIRLLCPKLRAAVGGLGDFESPVDDLAELSLPAERAVIVENLETGIALPDIDGCVAVMKLGNAVSALGALPWLQEIPTVYWGDLDTHGFVILDRARKELPRLRSVLMDEQTLLTHRPLWGQEPTQSAVLELPHLTESERLVYAGLRSNRWGQKIRLEQERLSWNEAVQSVRQALAQE